MAKDNLTRTTSNPSEDSEIPPYIWPIIHQLLLGVAGDKKLDLREPHPKKSLEGIASYIIFAYGVLVVYGVLSNIILLIHIIQNRLYKDPTYAFIINNVISDIVKCVVVLPITLYVLLIQNWMLGELLCTFLPMLQDIPLHVTVLTYTCMAWDRYRYLRNPNNPRLPAFVCTIGTWLTSLCLVLPYPIYIMHIDLGEHFKDPDFIGVSICIVNLADDMKEYMRGIFLVTYAGPLAAISYFLVCASRELSYHNAPAVIFYEPRSQESRSRIGSHSTATVDIRSSRGEEYEHSSQYSPESLRGQESGRTRYEVHESELDVIREKRTQKYLGSMITTYAICLLPLMIMRLARLALVETYDNSSIFDYTYVLFVWLAFLPTCLIPPIFACWQMSRSKQRLMGYFRFSNRKFQHSCETVVTADDTPALRLKFMHGSQQLDEGYSDGASSILQDSHSS